MELKTTYTLQHPQRNALGSAAAAVVQLRLAAGALDILDTLSRRDSAVLNAEQMDYIEENLDRAWLALYALAAALPWYRIPQPATWPVSWPCPEEAA